MSSDNTDEHVGSPKLLATYDVRVLLTLPPFYL